MKSWLPAVLGFALGVVLVGLLSIERRASSADIAGIEIERIEKIGEMAGVRVEGSLVHSALAVKEIRFSTPNDQTIDIDLVMASGRRAPSGSFDCLVFTRPSTTRIRIAKDRVVVWTNSKVGVKP